MRYRIEIREYECKTTYHPQLKEKFYKRWKPMSNIELVPIHFEERIKAVRFIERDKEKRRLEQYKKSYIRV